MTARHDGRHAARANGPRRRAARVAMVALAGASFGLAGVLQVAPAVPAEAATASSAVTVEGKGDFAGLKVTVSQTKQLVNQVVTVDWKGAAPTLPENGGYSLNFVQIMQCWGDDPAGPEREKCQFGGIGGDSQAGQNTGSRQITLPPAFKDAEETQYPGPSGSPNVYVPFKAVNGETVNTATNQFFDRITTNEVPYGRTRADGTGRAFFEVQTGLEASGLGCGQIPDGASTPRNCWLVIVPRNDREVDGSLRGSGAADALVSSPLTTSNWKHRLVVPLQFQSIGRSCPIGSAERRTLGSELVSLALVRWQPALCANGGTNFAFSQVSDTSARRTLASSSPGLVFLSDSAPRDPDDTSPRPVYAPVALSGLTVAFNLERQTAGAAPAEIRKLDGLRLEDIRLTPRLLAKMVTQSYLFDAGTIADTMAKNPFDISYDPEFRALNPVFSELLMRGTGHVLLPTGLSDANRLVQRYIVSDREAREFLAGKPDPSGMVVNPTYRSIGWPREDWPRADIPCATIEGIPVDLCVLDRMPVAPDMFTGARAASRGDSLARTVWNPGATPPSWGLAAPDAVGRRRSIAVVDTASASRFSLVTAKLRNAAGAFVAPTPAALLAGVGAMKKDAAGVLVTDVASKSAKAYPLTTLTYAATTPALLTPAERRDYAALLTYIAGPGQIPGDEPGRLPVGFVPLPAAQRAQALAAATAVRTATAPTPTPTPTPTRSSEPTSTSTPFEPTPDTGGSGSGDVTPTPTVPAPSGSTTPTPTATPSVTPVAATAATPATPAGSLRFALVTALALGGAALLFGAVLPWFGRRGL